MANIFRQALEILNSHRDGDMTEEEEELARMVEEQHS